MSIPLDSIVGQRRPQRAAKRETLEKIATPNVIFT
jgi:hypothetical protein